jgi:hypothetical protein
MSSVRHEVKDLDPGRAAIFMASLLFFVAVALALSFGVFRLLKAGFNPLSNIEAQVQNFPEPRLQVAPRDDLIRLQEKERNLLRTYGWVDREHRMVRIPIERAIETAAQQGLPEFPNGDQK